MLLSGFSQTSPHEVCFNVSSAPADNTSSNASNANGAGGPAALLVVLEAGGLDGEFSDNLLTLEPCRASGFRRVCFSTADATVAAELGQGGSGSGGGGLLDLDALRGNITATALNSEGSLWWTGG